MKMSWRGKFATSVCHYENANVMHNIMNIE